MIKYIVFRTVLTAALIICGLAAQGQKYTWKTDTSGGYAYRYVTNDPARTRFYTLKNGLTVILSQNSKAPRIVFRMAVRAGSTSDPRTATGLAHYLEHLLFKGTDRFGTLNYAKEKPLLEKIQSLFENYRHTIDTTRRKQLYKQIDATSLEASSYSIAGEYDKIMEIIGSTTTNAYTSAEKTVYIEDLPSGAIDQLLELQGERFRAPVFRNFHTELEVVYEEKNRWLDDDRNQMYQKTLSGLFPTHNYGRQTTIGTIADLKNPSLVEIKKYYNRYYVPNNMAIIMAGDFNYDTLIEKINRNFAYMVARPLRPYSPAPEVPLTKPHTVNLYGPGNESLFVSYRGGAQNTRESLLLQLISRILSNGQAGLMDVGINQRQKMLGASASYTQLKDYGVFSLMGSPKEGQTLAEARQLLLEQIERLKNGDFDESLISAVVANEQVSELRSFENNEDRADNLVEAFTLNKAGEWDRMLATTDRMRKVTKQEIVLFARRFFLDNYVAVLKHNGERKTITKVAKPEITAIKTNPESVSAYARKVMDAPVRPAAAVFLDYRKDLSFTKAGIADVISVPNKENALFRMTYRFDFGSDNNRLLPYAAQYLAFLGTDKYSAEQIKRLFYNIACSYSINVGREKTVISIGGLQQNFDKAVTLLEHILSHCKINSEALSGLKSRILKGRENAKSNKGLIMSGLTSYAQFGPDNPFNYVLTGEQISQLKAAELTEILHRLTNYRHTITYYGPLKASLFTAAIARLHQLPDSFLSAPAKKRFEYTKTSRPQVYFANYPMVQTEMYWVRNMKAYDPRDAATITTFNNYFGDGMGSIVSQTIRESKALAYSTFAMIWAPDSKEKQTSMLAYVGTQADKMNGAISAMNSLLTTLPVSESAFERSKASIINGLKTSRITGDEIISAYLEDKKLGLTMDGRILKYAALRSLRLEDMVSYYKQNLSGKPYNYCILGAEKNVNGISLQNLGKVTRLTLEQIFGY